jgi:putative DNA-invertase from lambdoid prophage Rac
MINELLKYADSKKIQIDTWIEETISGTKSAGERKLGQVIVEMKENDLLIVCELSRLGRNLMEVMSVLHQCMTKNAKIFSLKEGYELGNNINSKVLAFAFSLSAEIERNLISRGSPLRAHQRSLGS